MERLEDQRVTFILPGDGQPHAFLAHSLTGTELLNLSSTLLKIVHRKSVHRDRECHCQDTDLLLPSTVEISSLDEPTFNRLRQFPIYRDYNCVALTPQVDVDILPSLSESLDKGNAFRKTAPFIYEVGKRFRHDALASCSGNDSFPGSLYFRQIKSPHMAGQHQFLLCHVKVYLAATRFCIPDLQALTLGRLRLCLYHMPCSERVMYEVFRLFENLGDYEQDGQDTEIMRGELVRYMVAHHAVLSGLDAFLEYLTEQPDLARDLYLYMDDRIREDLREEEEVRSIGGREVTAPE